MKIKLSMAIFSLFTLLNTSVLAQDGPRINREVACSVNDGFAMSDVAVSYTHLTLPTKVSG